MATSPLNNAAQGKAAPLIYKYCVSLNYSLGGGKNLVTALYIFVIFRDYLVALSRPYPGTTCLSRDNLVALSRPYPVLIRLKPSRPLSLSQPYPVLVSTLSRPYPVLIPTLSQPYPNLIRSLSVKKNDQISNPDWMGTI